MYLFSNICFFKPKVDAVVDAGYLIQTLSEQSIAML